MFGLFKKPKNPTLGWDPVLTESLHLNVDTRELNGVSLGCQIEDLKVFGNATRFEIISKTDFVLSYTNSGFALVTDGGTLATIDIYVSADSDDGHQACGELVVSFKGRDLCITPQTSAEELKHAWGNPSDEHDDGELHDLVWDAEGCLLSIDRTKENGIQNVELHPEV